MNSKLTWGEWFTFALWLVGWYVLVMGISQWEMWILSIGVLLSGWADHRDIYQVLRKLVGWWLMREELKELDRWSTLTREYSTWFERYPDIHLVLTNLRMEAGSTRPLSVGDPLLPWDLRARVEQLRAAQSQTSGVVRYEPADDDAD